MVARTRLTILVLIIASLFSAPLSRAASIPPGEAGAKEILDNSPRHHEWTKIALPGTETVFIEVGLQREKKLY